MRRWRHAAAWLAVAATLFSLPAAAAATAPRGACSFRRFQIIEWQPRSAPQLATLKRLGVTGGMVTANRHGDHIPDRRAVARLRGAGLCIYIENIATDFYSAYHRWFPDHPVNWRFVTLQRRHRADPADLSVFIRDPSLSDPVWLARIARRLTQTVRATAADHPLFYNLGDETGIADLTAYWDFDTSPKSLAGFRAWLRTQYPSLAALNAEWGTRYPAWEAVRPELTDAAMARTDDNYAAWNDFKAWMDVAFARALRAGTDAVHRADPAALAAIEGAQVPGWGGYDYARLAPSVDVMEIYDADASLDLARAFNPRLVLLSTSFGVGPRQLHRIWQEWLRGTRGLVLWDQASAIVGPDAAEGPAGRAYAPVFHVLRGPVGRAVIDSTPVRAPVAILYSPVSFRVAWMLEQRPKGPAWAERSSEQEGSGDAERMALAADAAALTHIGLPPHFIDAEGLAHGALRHVRALILPHAIALSDASVQAIAAFTARGGLVIADSEPGVFDGHGKRRAAPPLAELFAGGHALMLPAGDRAGLTDALARAGVRPRFAVAGPISDVTTYVLRHGATTILAVQRDYAAGAGAETVHVTLPGRFDVTDLLNGQTLGARDELSLRLGVIAPAVLALRKAPR